MNTYGRHQAKENAVVQEPEHSLGGQLTMGRNEVDRKRASTWRLCRLAKYPYNAQHAEAGLSEMAPSIIWRAVIAASTKEDPV